MEKKIVDCVVIGGGPGGYPAAIRLAEKGKKVCLVEAYEIGGTCLNRGCIPTKAYLANSSMYRCVKKASSFGIKVQDVSFDWSQMKKRKDEVVTHLRTSLTGILRSYGIDIVEGHGSFVSPTKIEVSSGGAKRVEIEAASFIIATGSEPKELPIFPYDGELIHSSTSLLDIDHVPSSLLIIGGGAIGCEFASIFSSFGTKVSMVEAMERILPLECPEVSQALTKSFKEDGIDIHTSLSVKEVIKETNGLQAILSNGNIIRASCALVCVGRKLNSEALGLDNAQVAVEKGAIIVDEHMRTSVSHIYAIGDVIGKALYAHAATHQGLVAAENILGHPECMRYDAIPGVIFTDPQIASVGYSLAKAKEMGVDAVATSYPMQGLGKAQAELETNGFAQLVLEKKTGRILGAQVVGADSETLIAEMVVAITNELTIECISDTIHAHPTFSEIWLEVSSLAQNIPIHFPKKQSGRT